MTEQGGSIPGLLYRGAGQAAGPTFIFAAMDAPFIWEATGSLTYVTGAHAFKVGFPQLVGRAGTARARHQFRHQLPLQQRRAESDHHARVTGHAHATN